MDEKTAKRRTNSCSSDAASNEEDVSEVSSAGAEWATDSRGSKETQDFCKVEKVAVEFSTNNRIGPIKCCQEASTGRCCQPASSPSLPPPAHAVQLGASRKTTRGAHGGDGRDLSRGSLTEAG